MSISGGAAISAALLQLGVYDPGETPSTSEQNACLLIANEMLANWFNEQSLALQVLLKQQNQAGVVLIGDQTKEGAGFIDGQARKGIVFSDEQAEYALPISAAFTLANGVYVAPTYTPASYTAPSYTPGSYTPGTAPTFPDLTTPQTFPTGYELAIVKNLAVKLAPQYPGVGNLSPELVKDAQEALLAATAAPGRMPIIGSGGAGVIQPPMPTPSATAEPPQPGQ